MNTRKPPYTYIDAMNCITQDGNHDSLATFQAILDSTHNETVRYRREQKTLISGGGYSGYGGETGNEVYDTEYYDEDVNEVRLDVNLAMQNPENQSKTNGELLLQAAVERRLTDFVELLLSRTIGQGFNEKSAIDLSPALFGDLLAMMHSSAGMINKNEKILNNGLDLEVMEVITKQEMQAKNAAIMQLLFIKFIDENIENKQVMIKLFSQIRNYLPKDSEEFNNVVKHFLKKVLDGYTRVHTELFAKLLAVLPESKEILNNNDILKKKLTCVHENTVIFNVANRVPVSASVANDYNECFIRANNNVNEEIKKIAASTKSKGISLYKSDRVKLVTDLHDKISKINQSVGTSLEKFEKMMWLLIIARNELTTELSAATFAKKSTLLDNLDKLIKNMFHDKPMINEIYRLESRKSKQMTTMVVKVNPETQLLYKTALKNLASQDKLSDNKNQNKKN